MKNELARRRYVILDRDGTIIAEKNYLADPNQVELLAGVAEGLRHMQRLGLGLIVATNQSAVGRGILDLATLREIHARMEALLAEKGTYLDGIFFCPHTPEDHCDCRKPLTGMVKSASTRMHFDPAGCFVIGDKPCDIELGRNIRAITFLTRTGYGSQVEKDKSASPDFIVDDLRQAAQMIEWILSQHR